MRKYAEYANSDKLRSLHSNSLFGISTFAVIFTLTFGVNIAINSFLPVAFGSTSGIELAPMAVQVPFRVAKAALVLTIPSTIAIVFSSFGLCAWFLPRSFILSVNELGVGLYHPMRSQEDWYQAHRR